MPELVESTAYWLYSPDEAEQQRPGSGRAQGIVESLSQRLSLRFRTHTETHRQQAPHGWISTPHEAITGTRSLHDDAWAPRQLLPPEPRELVALAAASPHIYYTPCGSPRKHQNSGASSRGIRGILPSVHRYLASLHVEPRRPVPVFSGRRPLSRALLPSLSAAFSAQRI